MRSLAEHDRGRVPFALVGVVLLVTSTAFHASLGAAPAVRESATEAALERGGAAVVPALRVAVRDAARAAAANPVVTPANTTVGRALDEGKPFRYALRLRIYLAVRERLSAVRAREDDIRATASLPPIEAKTAAVRRAIERVEIHTPTPNGTRLRVQVRNVTLRATRGSGVVARTSLSPTVTVETPVLALHDRTERYERRLDGGALDPSSAAARLTLGAYLVAYARGSAQWAGAPVANVLGNRHLALATGTAVYDAQRRTFGNRDPEWVTGFATTAKRVASRDAVELGFEGVKRGRSPRGALTMDILRGLLSSERERARPSGPFERDLVTVRVGRSADGALAAMLRRSVGGRRNLTRVLDASYTIDARLATRTRRLGSSQTGQLRPARGSDWQLVDEQRRVRSAARPPTVHSSAAVPSGPGDWHRLAAARRLVTVRTTLVRHWRAGDRTAVTRRRSTTRYEVDVAVLGRHARPHSGAPGRPVHPIHRAGGALAGPSLSAVGARARGRLVTARGGFDRIAERAVAGTVNTTAVSVRGRQPARLSAWVRRDLRELHRRVRNVSRRYPRRQLGTFEAMPAADLAATLRHRRHDLLDPPRTYDGVADRARVGARAAYLDRVIARLDVRAERRERTQQRLDETLAARGLPSLDRLRRLHAAAANATGGPPAAAPNGSGSVRFVPDATPTRLSLTRVSRADAGLRGEGAVRPLAARNLNVFTFPGEDAASFVRGGGRKTVPLRTAARTLRATEVGFGRTGAAGSLNDSRNHLRTALQSSNDALRAGLRRRLRREGIEGAARRRMLVTAGLARWETPADRTLALVNGSAASAVAEATAERGPARFREGPAADRLELLLDAELRRMLDGPAGRVERRPTGRTWRHARDLRDAAVTEATKLIGERTEAAARRRLYRAGARTLPAGLPVLPPVQPWYATINVWYVRVRGVHPSLVVRARGTGRPGPPTTYERDGRAVRVDVDGDGEHERLGRATRIGFDIETAVLVVVPPGGHGVGDIDGNADERTGWPTPDPWPDADRASGPRAVADGP